MENWEKEKERMEKHIEVLTNMGWALAKQLTDAEEKIAKLEKERDSSQELSGLGFGL